MFEHRFIEPLQSRVFLSTVAHVSAAGQEIRSDCEMAPLSVAATPASRKVNKVSSAYVGHWKALTAPVGSVNAKRGWADVVVKSNGAFSGRAGGYVYAYTWNMSTIWGTIPEPVYRVGTTFPIKGSFAKNGTGTVVVGGKTYRATYSKNSSGDLVITGGKGCPFTNCIMKKQAR